MSMTDKASGVTSSLAVRSPFLAAWLSALCAG